MVGQEGPEGPDAPEEPASPAPPGVGGVRSGAIGLDRRVHGLRNACGEAIRQGREVPQSSVEEAEHGGWSKERKQCKSGAHERPAPER